jgi:hypothetical protein
MFSEGCLPPVHPGTLRRADDEDVVVNPTTHLVFSIGLVR